MNRIKELREQKKMTQVRLSVELEVSQECVSAYEKGKNYPAFKTLLKLSEIFGVSIDYIMGLSDNPLPARRLSKQEQLILSLIAPLDEMKKEKIISYIEGISEK